MGGGSETPGITFNDTPAKLWTHLDFHIKRQSWEQSCTKTGTCHVGGKNHCGYIVSTFSPLWCEAISHTGVLSRWNYFLIWRQDLECHIVSHNSTILAMTMMITTTDFFFFFSALYHFCIGGMPTNTLRTKVSTCAFLDVLTSSVLLRWNELFRFDSTLRRSIVTVWPLQEFWKWPHLPSSWLESDHQKWIYLTWNWPRLDPC